MTISVSYWAIEMYAYTRYTRVLMKAKPTCNWRNGGLTKETDLELGCDFFFLTFIILYVLGEDLCMRVRIMAHLWKLEDTLSESVLCFHCVCPLVWQQLCLPTEASSQP